MIEKSPGRGLPRPQLPLLLRLLTTIWRRHEAPAGLLHCMPSRSWWGLGTSRPSAASQMLPLCQCPGRYKRSCDQGRLACRTTTGDYTCFGFPFAPILGVKHHVANDLRIMANLVDKESTTGGCWLHASRQVHWWGLLGCSCMYLLIRGLSRT